MMTDNDLRKALEIVLQKTRQKSGEMLWQKSDTGLRTELVGVGIPGYRVKVIEEGRRYSARIAMVDASGKSRVVGVLSEQSSERARDALEPIAFAIFREAIDDAEGEDYQKFTAAAQIGGISTPGPDFGLDPDIRTSEAEIKF
jgi:hypothetical protein